MRHSDGSASPTSIAPIQPASTEVPMRQLNWMPAKSSGAAGTNTS
jgi:hypothetical protein